MHELYHKQTNESNSKLELQRMYTAKYSKQVCHVTKNLQAAKKKLGLPRADGSSPALSPYVTGGFGEPGPATCHIEAWNKQATLVTKREQNKVNPSTKQRKKRAAIGQQQLESKSVNKGERERTHTQKKR